MWNAQRRTGYLFIQRVVTGLIQSLRGGIKNDSAMGQANNTVGITLSEVYLMQADDRRNPVLFTNAVQQT
ncbi:hypothetical protein GY14_31225 [Delftia tsuruhatensis]|nr:hypothetical protein GY14_31225 [Delftia tsuruhatensis]